MRGFNWLEYAEVAELVDAHDSGSCVRKDVGVRVSPSAPVFTSNIKGFNVYICFSLIRGFIYTQLLHDI